MEDRFVYCKNCGKKLDDNARFCDRCNMSVRKKEDRMNRIEELKEERLARRKAKAVEERRKNIKKIKRKRRGSVVAVIIIIIAIGVASGVMAYINYINTSTFNERTDVAEQTEQPTESAAPAVVIGDVKENGDSVPTVSSAESDNGGYTSAKIAGMSFTYPSSFTEGSGKNVLLYVTDGDAEITANKTVTNQEPKELMKKYADETGGTPSESMANDTGYEVTLSVGASVYHKKSRVENGTETYYEIKYPASSSKAAEYDEYIEYMDSFF